MRSWFVACELILMEADTGHNQDVLTGSGAPHRCSSLDLGADADGGCQGLGYLSRRQPPGRQADSKRLVFADVRAVNALRTSHLQAEEHSKQQAFSFGRARQLDLPVFSK